MWFDRKWDFTVIFQMTQFMLKKLTITLCNGNSSLSFHWCMGTYKFFFLTCCPFQTQSCSHILGYISGHDGIIYLKMCRNKEKEGEGLFVSQSITLFTTQRNLVRENSQKKLRENFKFSKTNNQKFTFVLWLSIHEWGYLQVRKIFNSVHPSGN